MTASLSLTTINQDVSIGINEANRRAVAYILAQQLADVQVLYTKTRNYHWNVTGMAFKSLHDLFGEQYAQLATFGDDIAERIRSLGYFAPGALADYLAATRLVESDHLGGNAEMMVQNLLNDHETLIQCLRIDVHQATDKYQDVGTGDFLTGLLEAHEKMAWMLRAHL